MRRLSLLFCLGTFLVPGCSPAPSKGTSPPEKPKVEADLAFTNLSKKAYQHLQIKTQAIALREEQERLPLTGWIMAKPGNEVTLTAPTACYVHVPKSRQTPFAGQTVLRDAELFELKPELTSVEKIQVAALKRSIESDHVKAQTTLNAADVDFKRAEKLHQQNLKSDQELELAKKAFDHAKEELKAANDKLKYFDSQSITLKAPQAGTILQVHAAPGQYVPASAPLVTIIDLDPVWVRVPVPEFDWPLVDADAVIEIALKNPNQDRVLNPIAFKAKPKGAVAQVDPLKHTADLWYEIEQPKERSRFLKDQMVTAKVPIRKKEKAPVVPTSAIVFDAHGHAWIYLERAEKDGKHQFERRPVELVSAVDDGLLVRSDLKGGDRIVTNGAAVLFSRDFFKTPVPEGDD